MLKKAVKLLRGSVCVRAKSAYPERMLNLCSARGIEFWDVRWIDDTALSFCVARGDLRALRRAAEGCGAEVSIERTAGTPFFFARLRRRHALFAGGILCAALLLVNSLFIWDFEVTGNETVPTETILHALREHGVHRGTFIYSFRSQDICNRVLPELKDLCWVAVNVRGCKAYVQVRERVRALAGPDVQTVVVSADDPSSVEAVRAFVPPNTTAVLIGKSGVGKSSLINMLVGHELQETTPVRDRDGKGRHTTVSREMVAIPGGGFIMDMPGVRGLGLWEADTGIGAAFADIEEAAERCRFRDCSHEDEPGCAVRAAVESGDISEQRYASYQALRQETKDLRARREEARRMRGEKASDRGKTPKKGRPRKKR